MRDALTLAGAIAMALVQVAPALAQPTDTMARPLPMPIPETRPTPLPAPQPGRPGGGWQGGNNGGSQGGNAGGGWQGGNNGGGWQGGNQGGNWQGGSWNGSTIRCESRNNRREYCRANTSGGVRLVRQLSNTPCRQNRSWGYDRSSVWVSNGCRGEFQLRYGGGNSSGGGGPSAGAIIGGVAVAGGLIALLSQGNKSQPQPNPGSPPMAIPQEPVAQPPFTPAAPQGPARITAETGGVTPSARPSLNTCLNEAARQIGATGGTEIRLDRLDNIEPGNGGYRFRFQLQAIYPDETRTIPTFCRATPTTLVELTFG